MTLYVGLGNPGPTYSNNRHNIGYMVVDNLIKREDAKYLGGKNFFGDLYKSGTMLLLKPTTYMNLSGKSVKAVSDFFKIAPESIVVIHDDLDLPFGAVRFKIGGGSGGHNGLKSIDSAIGRDYIRVRVGIDKPQYKSQVADYVLSDFDKEQESNLPQLIEYLSDVLLKIPNWSLDILKSRYTLKDIKSIL